MLVRRMPPTAIIMALTTKATMPTVSRITPTVWMLKPDVFTVTANSRIAPTTTRTIHRAVGTWHSHQAGWISGTNRETKGDTWIAVVQFEGRWAGYIVEVFSQQGGDRLEDVVHGLQPADTFPSALPEAPTTALKPCPSTGALTIS